ncbi:hypothetical protein GON26_13590 [Flavobacterium sp. GA093]|uniref:Uncharacterized protein n=1 Tax=Flavobacterium hydrocarbonoxydans TaxID=2683249 RepID=A0A6I4NWG4_9FLAO|nr:hypothetical protein [Flavobacterium hydrocarbonoxydans]MWB95397.1 hypothetical protein [Flavobacterium hydrocarbonoxydans]
MKFSTLLILLIGLSLNSQAQSSIGKIPADGAGILDFKQNTTLGIVLPHLTSTAKVVTPGTLFYDVNTKKVMYRDNNSIQDLSIKTGNFTASTDYTNLIVDNSRVTVVGASGSSATGIVILESATKALILPKVASPHLNIVNPEPGTICYDTVKNLFCVYDGKEWAFWGK